MYCLELISLPVPRPETRSPIAAVAERLPPDHCMEFRVSVCSGSFHLYLLLPTAALAEQAKLELRRSGCAFQSVSPPDPCRSSVLLHRRAERCSLPQPGRPAVTELYPAEVQADTAALIFALQQQKSCTVSFGIRRSPGGLDTASAALLREQRLLSPSVRELLLPHRLAELAVGISAPQEQLALITAECARAFDLQPKLLSDPVPTGEPLLRRAVQLVSPVERSFTLTELRPLTALEAYGRCFVLPYRKDTLTGAPVPLPHIIGPRLRLGFTAEAQPVDLPLSLLRQHLLLTGAPGSGKGNELFSLALQLEKAGVPFLIIESAKEELHHLGMTIPALRTWRPTAGGYVFSPFTLPNGVSLQSYRSSLLQLLRSGFHLDGPLEELFSSTLNRCYAKYGYTDSSVGPAAGRPFGIHEFIVEFRKLVESGGYSQKTKSDMETAGVVRLKRLPDQNPAVFDSACSIPVDELTKGSNLLQLSCLRTVEAKQSFATLLLISLAAYLRSTAAHCTDRPLRFVILMDESHNLLERTTDSRGETYSFAADFRNLLLELRSAGVGFVVADQSSRNLPKSIADTCAVKLFMGSSLSSGITDFADTLALDEAARSHLYLLGAGEGICSFPNLPHALYFRTGNLIDHYLARPCPPRNAYLEANPRLTLEVLAECGSCPCRGSCCRSETEQARQLADLLYQDFGSPLEKLLSADAAESKAKLARLCGALLVRAKQEARTPTVLRCSLIRFTRFYNRDRRIQLDPAALLADAEKLLQGL